MNSQNLSAAPNVKRRLQKKYPPSIPGKASDYIKHFPELIRKNGALKVVIYARESTGGQYWKGNLDDQKAWLKQKPKGYEVAIVTVFGEIASGSEYDRIRLQAAAKLALQTGAVLLAESTDRFIRSIDYHSVNNPSAQPTMAEYEELKWATRGVTLATILHPDMPWQEVRGHQTKRGQDAKGNKGGRPKTKKNKPGYKKQRRIEKLQRVLSLRKKGASWGDIFALTDIHKTTASDWVKKYGK